MCAREGVGVILCMTWKLYSNDVYYYVREVEGGVIEISDFSGLIFLFHLIG